MVTAASVDQDDDGFPHPFGQYLLLENFARGGMGEVYLAKAGGLAGLEKYCVLKKLRSELTRDREYVTRFIDEARVVVTLNHANICHVFDVGRVGDEYYLAMEYVSGRDVRTIIDRSIKRERPLPAACTLNLVCETLEALDYAHRRVHPISGEALNLVHRDVSPQNVLVSFEGEVKLIDFGLAASKLKVERTQPNVVMGKMAYMAPEQARGDQIDLRADLFACGVLCYELLAGERYYEGKSANDIWNVAGKGGFIPDKWDKIDPEIAKILAKALHPDAKKRYATCGDFREALASLLHWRFPGSGVKSLRDVMSDLFAEEIAREREMMARFGKVNISTFREELESTKSHSITLVQAGTDKPEDKATQLVRNEQSQSAGTMPPPSELRGDLHKESTRLVADRTNAQTRSDRSTDEGTAKTGIAPRPPTPEMTARVQRASSHEATMMVRDRGERTSKTTLDLSPEEQASLSPRKGRVAVVGMLLGSAVVVLGVALFATGGDPPPTNAVADRRIDPPAARPIIDATPVPAVEPAVAPAPVLPPPPAVQEAGVAADPPAKAVDPPRLAAPDGPKKRPKSGDRPRNEAKAVAESVATPPVAATPAPARGLTRDQRALIRRFSGIDTKEKACPCKEELLTRVLSTSRDNDAGAMTLLEPEVKRCVSTCS